MKKKGLSTICEVSIENISEAKTTNGQTIPDFMLLKEVKSHAIQGLRDKTRAHTNQTWSMPDRTYTWFPYYSMYLTSK